MGEGERELGFLGLRRAEKVIESILEGYAETILSGVFKGEHHRDMVEYVLKSGEEAILKLRAGKTEKAIEFINWNLENEKQIKKHLTDKTNNAEEIEKAESKIRQLEMLKSELESM